MPISAKETCDRLENVHQIQLQAETGKWVLLHPSSDCIFVLFAGKVAFTTAFDIHTTPDAGRQTEL